MVFALGVSAVLFLAASSTSVLATPWPQPALDTSKHATHRVRSLPHGVDVVAYQPESVFETFGEGVDHPLSKRADVTPEEAAISFLASKTGINESSISYRTGFEGEAATHVYAHQSFNGIDVTNAVSNVALKNGKVVSYGAAFVKPTSVAAAEPSLSSADAIAKAEAHLQGKYNDWATELKYVVLDTNKVVLTHQVQVQTAKSWFLASVDAHTGEVVNVVDYTAHASYLVIPYWIQNGAQQTITDPQNLTASPNGWHTSGTTSYTTTRGNNLISYKSTTTGTTTQSSATLNFIYPSAAASAPTTTANLNAARTNGFYVGNFVHDLTYLYGFTESAYNFQFNNNGKGGVANDGVTLSIQDSAGNDNADFSTPADGQSGHCRMYTWDYTSPGRDGALENDIPVHEFTHGTTNRLTGGGTGSCLQTTEAGGMGEGWSDTFAVVTEQVDGSVPNVAIGKYVINSSAGIRAYPYSTSATTNPYTYASLKTLTEVHGIGTVWANILYNVYGALVTAHGWNSNIFDTSLTTGNVVFLHLFMDALPLQPCNPTFLTARNAIIQADTNRYAGANKCVLWKAFASKGLGVNAASHNNDATVPSGC